MHNNWRSTIWAALSLAAALTSAQDAPDLGKLLGNQSDLTTFFGLIQVRGFFATLYSQSLNILQYKSFQSHQLTYD